MDVASDYTLLLYLTSIFGAGVFKVKFMLGPASISLKKFVLVSPDTRAKVLFETESPYGREPG